MGGFFFRSESFSFCREVFHFFGESFLLTVNVTVISFAATVVGHRKKHVSFCGLNGPYSTKRSRGK